MKQLLNDFIFDLQAQDQSFQVGGTGLDDSDEFKKFLTMRLCAV